MKDKNLPLDYDSRTLEELTDEANQIIKSLEEKEDLDNSVDSYQQLLKLNNLIEKKFQKNFRSISEKTNKKIKEIIKRKWKINLTKLQKILMYSWRDTFRNKEIPN